jgi:hypothetical protein
MDKGLLLEERQAYPGKVSRQRYRNGVAMVGSILR